MPTSGCEKGSGRGVEGVDIELGKMFKNVGRFGHPVLEIGDDATFVDHDHRPADDAAFEKLSGRAVAFAGFFSIVDKEREGEGVFFDEGGVAVRIRVVDAKNHGILRGEF